MIELLLANSNSNDKIPISYSDFERWINSNKNNLIMSSNTGAQTPGVEGSNTKPVSVNLIGDSTRTMWGSPYGTYVTYDSPYIKIARHCLPSTDVFNNVSTLNPKMIFKFADYGSRPNYLSVSRNGLTSSTYGSYTGFRVIDCVYFDYTINKVMRVNPSARGVPIQFNGVI